MNAKNLHTLGIDIGSTTVKIAILNDENEVLFSDYERHFANIQETLSDLLGRALYKLGPIQVSPVITGSGGLTLAKHLGVPFVQEVIAVSTALQDYAPQTDVAIELGGEDAKIIYFEGRCKIKNLKTGATIENTFRAGEKVPKAQLDRRTMQYLYFDGENYVFMDNENFDQITLSEAQLAGGEKYLKENMDCQINMYQGDILGVELPNTVELKVIETEPGIKGDTTSGGSKPATLETGVIVNVDDVLRIDTRSGDYIERA